MITMKTTLLKPAITVISGIGIFLCLCACHCNKEEIKPDPDKNTSASAQYICPMNCENGKTYNAAGSCPVCSMDLAVK